MKILNKNVNNSVRPVFKTDCATNKEFFQTLK
jgi:hypothetical protein